MPAFPSGYSNLNPSAKVVLLADDGTSTGLMPVSLLGAAISIAPGSSTVARTLTAQRGDIVTVTDYGADPTGKIDATAAFQAAITDAVKLASPFILVPAGTYAINGTLTNGAAAAVFWLITGTINVALSVLPGNHMQITQAGVTIDHPKVMLPGLVDVSQGGTQPPAGSNLLFLDGGILKRA